MINERERQDYHRPSTPLFRSFIADDLVSRYSTAPLVAHATVTSVSFGKVHVQGRKVEDGFVVRSRGPDGTEEIRGARAVVLAVGPSEAPNVPRVIREAVSPARDSDSDGDERVDAAPWRKGDISGEGWCHSSAFAVPGLRPMDGPLGARVKQGLPTRVVVLGGGCAPFFPPPRRSDLLTRRRDVAQAHVCADRRLAARGGRGARDAPVPVSHQGQAL